MRAVEGDVRKVHFTSDHGIMTDWDANFAGEGGNVFTPVGGKGILPRTTQSVIRRA
ncbi:MAG: hypothetical protein K6T99_00035 [Armatimonadetes bacterium]|nr:hypothetical protein [Armatimonadota bacterium]